MVLGTTFQNHQPEKMWHVLREKKYFLTGKNVARAEREKIFFLSQHVPHFFRSKNIFSLSARATFFLVDDFGK